MASQFNQPPGSRKKENPNEKLVYAWKIAYFIARREDRIRVLSKKDNAKLVVEEEKKALRRRTREASPETIAMLEEARSYLAIEKIRDEALENSPVCDLKDKLNEQSIEDDLLQGKGEPVDDEEFDDDMEEAIKEASKSFLDHVKDFALKLARRLTDKNYTPVSGELTLIIKEIYSDIMEFEFTTSPSTPERKAELEKLSNLKNFADLMETMANKRLLEVGETGSESIDRLIDSIREKPGDNIVASLVRVLRFIMQDLETRNFPPLPQLPEKVKAAFMNLERSGGTVN